MDKSPTTSAPADAAQQSSGSVIFVSGKRKPRKFQSLADAGQLLLRTGVIDPRAI